MSFTVKWLVERRRWYLVMAVAVIVVSAVVLAFVLNQESVSEHMYPQDAIYENSNVTVQGVVVSAEQNHKSLGLGSDSYHIFRFYIKLNITEVVWVDVQVAGSSVFSDEHGNIVGIGYDNLDDPQFSVGQAVECRGYYRSLLESPFSSMITVAPTVSGSYLEVQV